MIPKVSLLDTENGKYLVWSSQDVLGPKLLADGIAEPATHHLCKGIINRGRHHNVLDLGANIGSFTIPLAKQFSEKVNFYCFEVQRLVYYQLCGNIFVNSLENVHAYQYAVGKKNGIIKIPKVTDYSMCWNVGGYSIDDLPLAQDRTDFPSELLGGFESVPMRTLDSMTEIPPSCLVKLDVEGHELEVLQGATDYLKRSGNPPILFEVWGHPWYQEKKVQLFQFLSDIGYDLIDRYSGEWNYLAQHSSNDDLRVEFKKNEKNEIIDIIIWSRASPLMMKSKG